LAVSWFSHFVFRLDSSGIDFDFQRPEFATSRTDALAFASAAFSSVVHRDRLFILAVVADTKDPKDEVTPCCLTNRCRQQPLPLSMAIDFMRFVCHFRFRRPARRLCLSSGR
jgi:hypothetical protein